MQGDWKYRKRKPCRVLYGNRVDTLPKVTYMSDATVLRPSVDIPSENRFARALANDDLLPLLSGLTGRMMQMPARRRLHAVPLDTARPRIAVIANQRSHRSTAGHGHGYGHGRDANMLYAAPDTRERMVDALEGFARAQVDLLVIDGGDGTVRDVMSAARPLFRDGMPPIAVMPNGKTNALANDLGIPAGWNLDAIVTAFRNGTIAERAPVEITYDGTEVPLSGFILGAGAFVRATMLAQQAHRMGAFNGTAVALSVLGGVLQTCLGRRSNPWRAGEVMACRNQATGETCDRHLYLMLLSTLRRFPLGLRPLGQDGDGLNGLAIDAPPRLLPVVAPAVLMGRESAWLNRMGYHRLNDLEPSQVTLENGFILDGELFPGGTMSVRAGAPLRFVVP